MQHSALDRLYPSGLKRIITCDRGGRAFVLVQPGASGKILALGPYKSPT